MHAERRATFAGLVAIGLWSSLALLATATAGIPPFQLLAMAFAVAGLSGLAWLLRPGGAGLQGLRQPWRAGALAVAALFGYHALYFLALRNAPAVEANLINYLWPLLVVVFAAAIGGARVSPRQWLGAGLGMAATVLLVSRGQSLALAPAHAFGYAAALAAAVVWALYSVLNRRFQGVASVAIVGSCLVVAMLGAAAHTLLEPTVVPTPWQGLLVLLIGLGPTGLAFWLWDYGTKHGNLTLLGSLSYAAPLLSTGLLLAAGRAQAHWTQAVAVALLVAAAPLCLPARRPSVR